MSSTWSVVAGIALACGGMLLLFLLFDIIRTITPPAWAIVRDVPSALFLALLSDLTATVPIACIPPTVLAVIEADLPGKALLAGSALAWSWRSCQPFLVDKGKRCAVQFAAALTAALPLIGGAWFVLHALCRDQDAFADWWSADMEARRSREAAKATLEALARAQRESFDRQESDVRELAKELSQLEAEVHHMQYSSVPARGRPQLRERPNREQRFCPCPRQGHSPMVPVTTWYQTIWNGVDRTVAQLDLDIQVMQQAAQVRADSMEELRQEGLQLLSVVASLRRKKEVLESKSSRPVRPKQKKPEACVSKSRFSKLGLPRKPVVSAPPSQAAPTAETHDAPCVQEPLVPDVPASSDVVDVPALLVSPALAGPEMDAALVAPLFPATLAGEMEIEPAIPQREDKIPGWVVSLRAVSLGTGVGAKAVFTADRAPGPEAPVALSTTGQEAGVVSAQAAMAAAHAPATVNPVVPDAMDLDIDVVSEGHALAAPHASVPMTPVAHHHPSSADNGPDNGLLANSSEGWVPEAEDIEMPLAPAMEVEDSPMPLAPAMEVEDSPMPLAPAMEAEDSPMPLAGPAHPFSGPATGSAFATTPSAPAPAPAKAPAKAPAPAPKVAPVTPAPVAAQQQPPPPPRKKNPPVLLKMVHPAKAGSSSSSAPKPQGGTGAAAGPIVEESPLLKATASTSAAGTSATGLTVPKLKPQQPAAVTSATGPPVPAPTAQEATPSTFATAAAAVAWAKKGDEPTYAISGVQKMEADFRQNIAPTLLQEPPYSLKKDWIEFFQATDLGALKEAVECAMFSGQTKISPARLATVIRVVAEKSWFSNLPNRVQLAKHMSAWWMNWMSQDIESEPDY